MTYASAPGKIVLWGEYAVLTGAAAGVGLASGGGGAGPLAPVASCGAAARVAARRGVGGPAPAACAAAAGPRVAFCGRAAARDLRPFRMQGCATNCNPHLSAALVLCVVLESGLALKTPELSR